MKKDKTRQFRFVALQSNEGKKYMDQYKVPAQIDSVILIKNEEAFVESEAAIEIGKMLPAPWKWSGIFRIVPLKIRDSIYRWIAKNRYRWFGKRQSCRIL